MIDNNFPLYVISFLLCFILTALLIKLLIPILTKNAEQPIYAEGPSWHSSKSGTPTMGGLSFVIAVTFTLLSAALYLFLTDNGESYTSLLICLIYAVLNSLIGIIDDTTKLKRKKNAGLTPKQKLLLQLAVSIAFILARQFLIPQSTLITFSFGAFDFGIFYYPLALLILIGITNCANLTDGIDGLASSVAFSASLSLFYLSCALFDEVSFISAAVMGASVGFLIFNLHPAKIFMGDTGSLFLGAIIAAGAITMKNPIIIIFIGGIYVIEGISVILQVLYYKLTGKRLFKMAPLHHHLEKCGWSETKICIVAIFITLLLAIPAYAFYMP